MKIHHLFSFTLLGLLTGSQPSVMAGDAELLQLLEKKCASCHKDDETPSLHGGIDPASLRKEKADVESILERVKLPADSKKRMPKSKGPAGGKDYHAPLTKEEIAVLETLAGAPAAEPANGKPVEKKTEAAPPSAIPAGFNTHCPVDTLQEADPGLSLEYSGRKVYFCCKQCMRLWEKHANYVIKASKPGALPQFKGMEEELGLDTINLLPQRWCPVREGGMILPGAPSVMHEGKKLSFFGKEEQEDWQKDSAKYAGHVAKDGSVARQYAASPEGGEKTAPEAAPEKPVPVSATAAGTPAEGAALGQSVLKIMESRCGACHGTNATEPKKFQFINDLKRLRESSMVNLSVLEDSKLYTVIKDGDMPYPTKAEKQAGKTPVPLTDEETATVLSWLRNGAPLPSGEVAPAAQPGANITQGTPPPPPARSLVTPADEVTAALADLQTVPREDQADVRYVSISPQHNNAAIKDDAVLENLRRGARKMLNSLSTGPRIATFPEVGPQKTLLRVRLSELGWDAVLWDSVASHYPNAIDTGVSTALGTACHATVPILRADWMAANATRPPLYHDILRLPKTQQELERQLGVNVNDNIARGNAIRAGFSKSGVSLANRMVERHDLGRGGSYWASYDFSKSNARGNLLQFPLGPKIANLLGGGLAFDHAGGEFVFTLPNGMHGYYVADTLGNRLDGAAPTNIVGDRDNITGRVEISNGLSCIICHSTGLKDNVPADEVRALAATFGAEEQRLIERLHPDKATFDAQMKKDVAAFLASLKEANAEPVPQQKESIGQLAFGYEEEITLEKAAAELGLAPATLMEKLDAVPSLTDVRITFRANRSFLREQWNDRFPELVARLTNDKVRSASPIATVGAGNRLQHARPVPVFLSLNKTTFTEGEVPEITIEAAEDCHLRLLYQDARGDITILFPNQFIADDTVRAGKSRLLPVPNPKIKGEQVAIEIFGGDDGKVFGTERFIAVATDQGFSDTASLLAAAREAFSKTKVPFATDSSKNLDLAMTKAARAISRPAPGAPAGTADTRLGFSTVTVTTRAK
jgi:mono/diheme cytochrome c family protein